MVSVKPVLLRAASSWAQLWEQQSSGALLKYLPAAEVIRPRWKVSQCSTAKGSLVAWALMQAGGGTVAGVGLGAVGSIQHSHPQAPRSPWHRGETQGCRKAAAIADPKQHETANVSSHFPRSGSMAQPHRQVPAPGAEKWGRGLLQEGSPIPSTASAGLASSCFALSDGDYLCTTWLLPLPSL